MDCSIEPWQKHATLGGTDVIQPAPFKTNHRTWGLGLILLMLVTAFGCSEEFTTTFTHRQLNPDQYRRAVENFNDAVRWREFNAAAAFIAPQQLDAYWQMADALNKYIRVSDYQVQRIDFNQKARWGMVTLRYHFYYPQDPSMRTVDLMQKWSYDEAAKQWWVVQAGLQNLLDAR
jgi:hypothetical protein